MVIYWRYQFWIDFILVGILSGLLASEYAGQIRISPSSEAIVEACRIWLAPILTLLGLVCATTAFLFTAIERSEFDLLRELGVEEQLWSVFSEIIFWLAVAAISAASLSFIAPEKLPGFIKGYSIFLFAIVSFCLLKFAWLMRHVIGVRASRS